MKANKIMKKGVALGGLGGYLNPWDPNAMLFIVILLVIILILVLLILFVHL